MKKQPQDLLGIGQQHEFKPYLIEDNWMVVTPGASSGRRQAAGKTVVALSKVHIFLKSEDDVKICIKHLEDSDRRFAMITKNPWDWDIAMYRGLVVKFAVEWYDKEFFENKKSAYLDPEHSKMYTQFGATVNDVKVDHFYVDKNGNEIKVHDPK